jgi:trans-aconitate methyltransferase
MVRALRRYTEPLPLNDFDDYDKYWVERGGEPIIHPRWRISVDFIPDGASVLDVGCGEGGFLDYLRERRPACTISGTDISHAAVGEARSKATTRSRPT